MSEPDDFELLDRWREGDGRSGDLLFRRHFPRIYRFFRSKIGGDAEDLAQRTFLACIEGRERFRQASSFRTYLFGVARNQLLMHLRRKGRGRDAALDSDSSIPASSPESRAKQGEERRLVLKAMQKLPVDFQVALELFYWEDMSVDEIAEVLDVPAGTIKSRLWRGREMLRKHVEDEACSPEVKESTMQLLNQWIRTLRETLPAPSGEPQDDAPE